MTDDLRNGEPGERGDSTEPLANSGDRYWTHSLAGVADALLVFFPALTLARKLSLPQITSFAGVVSATTRAGFETWTNYAQFALCALVVWLAFYFGYRRGRPLLAGIWKLAENPVAMSRRARAFTWAFAGVALAVYLVNVTGVTLDEPLTDLFEEGEYLGFIPAFAAGKAVLASTFTAHGPGVDLLPGFVSSRVASPANGIVATRFVYAALRTVAVIASLLAVMMFARLLAPAGPRARWLASSALAIMFFVVALQIGAWADVPTFHKTVNTRDAGFLLQLLAVLALAQLLKNPRRPLAALALAVAIGASLPSAVFYSYDRGLYGAVFLFLVSTAFAICGGRSARIWFIGLSIGAVIGSAVLYATFGLQGIAAVQEQVGFWVRYGRAIWAYAGMIALPDTFAGMLLAGSFIALALGAVRVVRAIAATRSLRDGICGEIGTIILCAASISCWRMAVERGDVGHVAWGVTACWIMLSVFAAMFVLEALRTPRFDAASGASGSANFGASILMVGVSAVAGCNLLFLDPYAAYDRLANQYYAALRTADEKILSPQQRGTLDAIRDDLHSSSCFYTLTSEGAWYYLLQRKSCSRFYQVTNARPLSAQREIVAALEATPPAVILFSSDGWSATFVDGVSTFNASSEVMRYVLLHYVPHKLVAGNWFWHRSDEALRFSDRIEGAIIGAPSEGTRASDLQLTGTYGNERMPSPPEALFVTDGNENTPIWAGRPNRDEYVQDRWSAVIPTAVLAAGAHRFRVWAFLGQSVPLLHLGGDIEVRIR